ncbi:MAG: NAD-dependent epimerase [Actinomycetota bacterium]
MLVLVTGVAGFIGYHTAEALLERGDDVVGIDVVSDYYDVSLKEARLERLAGPRFELIRGDLAVASDVAKAFDRGPERVVHLAAQVGVRHSLRDPRAYVDANIVGFLNLLEACREHRTDHLVYASSSSVYGANTLMPFSVHQNVDHPVSLYAASKKANELMAHTYSHLFGLPTTGLRFFTVYGPWGRPDMALALFTRAIVEGRPIQVFNEGHMKRDFTYVDDVVEGVVRVLDRIPDGDPSWSGDRPDPATSSAPYRLYDIGNSEPVELLDFVATIERELGMKADLELVPMQPGDVVSTYADTSALERDVDFAPRTPLAEGVGHYVKWFRSYYGV